MRLSLIWGGGRQRTAYPSVHPPKMGWSINGYLGKPWEGKLWKLGCHSGPVSQGNGLISITGSKVNVTGDERLQLHAATACTPTLPLHYRDTGPL